MAITKERKQELVKEWEGKVSSSKTIFFVSYQGLKANEINRVRMELKKEEGELKVIKNRLFKRVLEEKMSDLGKFIDGPTGVVFISKDGFDILKKLFSLKKEFPLIKVRGGLMEGNVLGEDDIEEISSLPSREVMIGKLLYTIQSPIIEIEYLLSGILRSFIVLLSDLIDKKREEEENGKKVK